MKSRIVVSLTMVAIFMLMASSVSAQLPRVNVMPGNEPGNVYPYTWPGRVLTIWGNVHDGTPPYTYVWEFGDGTPPVSGAVANPKYISVTHAYATMGPKLAVLTVTDANSLSDQDMVEIEVAPKTFDVEVNAAIEDGLRYLYLQQWSDGRWRDYGCDAATTAMAVLAFENQGHLPINDFDEDIYAEYVKAGLDYLTSILRTQAMSVQGAGDPEEIVPGNTDANGLGVYPQSCYTGYETGMVMMAMVGSGPLASSAPDLIAPNGPAGIVGRTYRELVVDMVDYCAWAQTEPSTGYYRGGWRYSANYSSSDNSVSQWPPIGLEAAETNWGISPPGFVKSELEIWINNTQRSGGSYDGAFYYTTGFSRDAIPATGAGICEMAFCDVPQSDTRFQRALSYLERAWGSGYNKGFHYSMYAVAKGCRIAVDDFGELSEVNYIGSIEWYPDYAQYLITTQNANGSWPTSAWGAYLCDAWALLVLQQVWRPCRPVAVIDAPSSVPPDFPFDLDGSGSYIPGGGCDNELVEWLWDFDKSDGLDWNNPDGVGRIVDSVTYSLPPGVVSDTFVITLRVADNSDPAETDIAEHIIIVNFENHPPIADAGGPYSGKVGELICFDGTGSVDPDTAVGDYIASYAWDLDGDGEFDDCFDSICCHSWGYEYSGYIGLVVTDSYGGESADTAYVTVYVSEMDVSVADPDISFSKSYPQPADAITITAVVRCDIDSDPVSDVLVRFYDGDPDVSVHQIGGDQIIPSMFAGDACPVAVSYVVGDSLPRHIYVRVDPLDEIEEYDESNNEAMREIKAVMECAIDIKPRSCPNPFRTADRGVLPVAILGTEEFDVTTVDPSTVQLEGVPALRDALEDVSTPIDREQDSCACTTEGADGYMDMTLKFDNQQILAALDSVTDGETRVFTLTGATYDGVPIEGQDCVKIIRKIKSADISGISNVAKPNTDIPSMVSLGSNCPNPFNPETDISFSVPERTQVSLVIYNILGKKVKTLVTGDMDVGTHIIHWDGMDESGDPVASGIYFYKFSAGEFTATKKMVLIR